MHDVALRAVKIAVATDAMICTIHFTVSFFVIIFPSYRLFILRCVASRIWIATASVVASRGVTTTIGWILGS